MESTLMLERPTYEQLEQKVKELENQIFERERTEKELRATLFDLEGRSPVPNEIRVSGIKIRWSPEHGSCSFEGLPVAMMWVDTTLAGLMSGVQAMVGEERFGLALQSEGRKSVETDWQVISQFKNFQEGFSAIGTIAAVAGWGEWTVVSLDEKNKVARFRVRDSWEGRYQKSLGVCWGSGMLAGKLAGYCSKLFRTNCWAEQTAFIAKGDSSDEFEVKPSDRSIEKEIEGLLVADEASRADMAVALQKLREEIKVRQRTENLLQIEKARFEALSENAPFGMVMVAKEGHFKYVNRKFVELFGYDHTDVPDGRTWFRKAYPAPDYRHKVISAWVEDLESLQLGEKRPRVFTVTCKDGTEKTVNFIPVQLAAGENVMTCEDITDRRNAEESLRESEERYRSLVAHGSDMIYIAQDGIIKFPNPATMAITGYTEEELAALPFTRLVHPEDRKMVGDRHRRRLLGEEVPSTYTFRILTKAEEALWVQLNAALITWEGRPGILCSLRDVTPQKKLEAQFIQAQKMEAVGILAGGIAHDFNNLLQAVLGYTEILIAGESTGDMDFRQLHEIRRVALRGAELVRQLLTFGRKVQSNPRPILLNQEIRQIERMLKRTLPKMIDVELNLSEELWTVCADPVQIGQIIMNLAVNAKDAMPEGGKLLIATRNTILDEQFCKSHLGSRPGKYALLTIADTGQGMNREVLKHLFEPFFTTKEVGKGTGLGLPMVYGIVKTHGGYIECDSELGRGTIFEIYLPAEEQAVRLEEPQPKSNLRGGTEAILLVDDEETLRNLGEAILTRYGYRVQTAPNGEAALEIYRGQPEKIHLVLLDLIMPGMGGLRCLEQLLTINPDVKVVITTGYSPEGPPTAVLETGARKFIAKPYASAELLQVVREALDQR
jgi:two-component system cell cycle sensor histidine kinase/response regulator CckA